MPLNSRRRARLYPGLGAALLLAPAALAAQRQAPEFTQQIIHVGNFLVVGPTPRKDDAKVGREVGDDLRGKLSKFVNKREARVVHQYDYRLLLTNSSYAIDEQFSSTELHAHARELRADEIVSGTVTRLAGGMLRVDANLVLFRDGRMRQPFEPVTARGTEKVAELLAPKIAQARVQLAHQRRCENAARAARATQAIQHARAGMAAYPRGTLARTCLLHAMRSAGESAPALLSEAQALLALDAASPFALEAAAIAYDTLKQPSNAADMWLRLQATDSTNIELGERVVLAMAEGGNARRAEPLIVKLSDANPSHVALLRLKWRIANENRSWELAVKTGEALMTIDAEARGDSAFYHRFARAYRNNAQIYKSVEIVSRGVAAFPGDPRLFALYTQFVKEEADSALPRGLMLHPTSAELLALNAKELRSRGQIAEALESAKKAVELDSTIAQGRLMVAQAEMELGRPDSAVVTLQRAAAAGEDKSAIARFALSKGNALFRAANGTERRTDFELAMKFLQLADSLQSTPQTKFVLGATALKVAQTALTEAPKLTSKEESCAISRLGLQTISLARDSLEAGNDVAPEAIKQFQDYLIEITPYADKQIAAFCTG